MPSTRAHLWHYAPFLRLLVPLMAGIGIQWYLSIPILILLVIAFLLIFLISFYFFLPDKRKFQFSSINGLVIHFLLFITGAGLTWANDIRNQKEWIGNNKPG